MKYTYIYGVKSQDIVQDIVEREEDINMEAYVHLKTGEKLPIQTTPDGTRFIKLKNSNTGQDEDWMCISDLAKRFNYKALPQAVLRHVDSAETLLLTADTTYGQHQLKFISNRGLIELSTYLKNWMDVSNTKKIQEVSKAQDRDDHIRTVIGATDGKIWLSATDVCKELGYKNPSVAVRKHVKEEDTCLITFSSPTSRSKVSLGITEQGYQDLRNARLHIQAKNVVAELITTMPEPIETTKTKTKRAKTKLWVPPFAGKIDPQRKCRGDRVAINFSYGSNWLLKGTKGYLSLQEYEDNGQPVHTQGIFNRFGYLINYPEEWEQAFSNTNAVERIPARHQMILDMLMSDYIEGVRKPATQEEGSYFKVPEEAWISHAVFEFKIVEWFTAFHSDLEGTRAEQKVRFKRWSDRVLAGLCYLMKAGVIQPVHTKRIAEVEERLQDILTDTTRYDRITSIPETEHTYTGETADAYRYRFRFAPCWIQEIASSSLPAPTYIPPILGRLPHGGDKYWHKYTCNRLLYTELKRPDRRLNVLTNGVYSISLKMYCQLTGVPLLSEWSASSNLGYNSMKRSRYEIGLIRNMLEAFGLFKVCGVQWKDIVEDRYTDIPSDKATIILKPLYLR